MSLALMPEPAPSHPALAERELHSRWLTVAGHPLHLIDVGTGPTLLFLHGAPHWSFAWRGMIAHLRDRFRCIALDYPGFGLSPAPVAPLGTRALSHLVELAVAQLDLEDVVLVMNDVGGAIGTGAAVRRPRRYRGLVAIDALGFSLTDFTYIRAMLALMRVPGARAVGARLDLLGLVLRLGGQRIADDADPSAVFASMHDLAGRRRSLDLLADLGRDTAFLTEIETGLSRLRSRPVLTAFGQLDPARLAGFPRRWARFFPDTTPVVIPGGRHFSHEDAPQACAAALARWYDARVAA